MALTKEQASWVAKLGDSNDDLGLLIAAMQELRSMYFDRQYSTQINDTDLLAAGYDFNMTDVNDVVDENGLFMASDAHLQRFEQFMRQLVWLATTLKYGRDHFEYK